MSESLVTYISLKRADRRTSDADRQAEADAERESRRSRRRRAGRGDREEGGRAMKSCDLQRRRREAGTGAEGVSDDAWRPSISNGPTQARREFQETYLAPIEPNVKSMLDADRAPGRGACRRRARVRFRIERKGPAMSETLSPDAPRRLLTDLCRLVAERAAVEEAVATPALPRATKRPSRSFRRPSDRSTSTIARDKAAVEKEYAATRERDRGEVRVGTRRAGEGIRGGPREDRSPDFAADQQAAEQALQDAHWEAMEAADAARGGLNLPLKEVLAGAGQPLAASWRRIHQQAVDLLQRRGHWDDVPEAAPVGVLLEKHPGRRFCHALEQAQAQFRDLSKQFLPQLFQGVRPLGIFLLLWARGGLSGDRRASAGTTGVGRPSAAASPRWSAHRGRRLDLPRRQAAVDRRLSRPAAHDARSRPGQPGRARSGQGRMPAAGRDDHRPPQGADPEGRRGLTPPPWRGSSSASRTTCSRPKTTYPKRLAELAAWRDRTLKEIEEKYPPLLRQIEEQYADRVGAARDAPRPAVEESQRRIRARVERDGRALADGHRAVPRVGRRNRADVPRGVSRLEHRRLEPLDAADGDSAGRFRFGRSQVKLADIDGGVPEDERLRPAQTEFALPVVLPFPRRSLLLLKAARPGPRRAVDVMQSAMLRLLTAMPPGKVRFTIIDPVGLGDNFSAFMHLADYDEQLVASRIWTDAAHIEQRLADLTKHMENVIQVYLRKEFHSIEEYNAFAGEMAEPYRVLVVANFPGQFHRGGRAAAQEHRGQRRPVRRVRADERRHEAAAAAQLPVCPTWRPTRWRCVGTDGQFVWEHPDFGPLAVEFDAPPPAERFKEIVRTVGSAAKDAGRVEVPFSCIVPDARTSGGPPTAAAASTCRWAGPAR